MAWSQAANRRRSVLKREFAEEINGISECLASYDQAASVAETHVDQAYQALARAGLSRRKWLDQPESLQALGALFVGFAFACPDAVTVLVSEERSNAVAAGMFVGSFLFGALLWMFGAYKSKLPTLPPAPWTRQWIVSRVGILLVLILAISVASYMLKNRLQGCCLPASDTGPTPAEEVGAEDFNTPTNERPQ